MAALRPATELRWHRVNKLVNNSRNKSEECNKPFEQAAKPEKPKGMLAWLTATKPGKTKIKEEETNPLEKADPIKRSISPTTTESAAKRPRCELSEAAPQEVNAEIKLEAKES